MEDVGIDLQKIIYPNLKKLDDNKNFNYDSIVLIDHEEDPKLELYKKRNFKVVEKERMNLSRNGEVILYLLKKE